MSENVPSQPNAAKQPATAAPIASASTAAVAAAPNATSATTNTPTGPAAAPAAAIASTASHDPATTVAPDVARQAKIEAGEEKWLYPQEPFRFDATNLNPLLVFSSNLKASDITFQTGESVIIEVHGKLHKVTKHALTQTEVSDILNFIYGGNGAAQLLSGQDVDTFYEMRPTREERFRYRVNGTACQVAGHNAIQITMRTIPLQPPTVQQLGIPKELLDVITPRDGVVYVTGPTGSGKSTLLAAVIRSIAEDPACNRKILTYEAPIEFVYDDINSVSAVISQSEIPRHLPTFAAGVRNALRRKPRLILVGEARDAETISAVIEAALTGHPVYTTLHTVGVVDTVRRLVGSFPAEERDGRTLDILETLRLIVCQKLLPSTDGKQVALREYLAFDTGMREALQDSSTDQLMINVRKMLDERGQSFLKDAKAKFEAGILPEKEFRLIELDANRQAKHD